MARKKKDPAAPKKTRWYHNVAQAYRMAYETDKALPWWMAAAMVATIAVGLVIGLLTGQTVYFLIIGVLFSTIAGMAVLARRAEQAAYARIEGQPGAALSALKTIRRGWTFGEEPESEGGEVLDLMDALRRSIEKNKPQKGRAKKTASKTSKKASPKKATAKKTTAKKAPAKKSAVKKTA